MIFQTLSRCSNKLKMDKLEQIKSLIGNDATVADEVIKYCRQIKTNSKVLNMKSYVLEMLDKTYNRHIL